MKAYRRMVSIIMLAEILGATQLFANTSSLLSINAESVEVYSNHLMINPKPLTLDIISQGVSIPYALYDYKMIDERVFVGANWLNTLFLADVTYDHEKNVLSVSYMTAEELASKIEELEDIITPRSADEALDLWIRGQQTRAGTLQYIALSDELKEEAITKASKGLWVTGGSSPSLGEFSSPIWTLEHKSEGIF